MSRTTQLLCVLVAILVAGILLAPHDHLAQASTDTTVVTIDPSMPDDFLNLYPELDNNELAKLPSAGMSITSVMQIGLLVVGVMAVALAIAMTVGRRSKPAD